MRAEQINFLVTRTVRNDSTTVTAVQQLRRRTAGLLQSLDNGLVGLYADLSLGPRSLVRCPGQVRLGLLQVGLGSLKIENNQKWAKVRPDELLLQRIKPNTKLIQKSSAGRMAALQPFESGKNPQCPSATEKKKLDLSQQ